MQRLSRATGRVVQGAVAAGLAIAGLVVAAGAASATPPHTGCAATTAGNSSGLCGLYPGNAVDNVKDLGQVAETADGTTLTITTQDAVTGAAPDTSFACLIATPADQIDHRLQDEKCNADGGVFLPFTGGTLTVDLTQFPQFRNTQFTVQIAANDNAGDPNGDAFYNNFSVSSVPATPVGGPRPHGGD